jgi:hypothetical protein
LRLAGAGLVIGLGSGVADGVPYGRNVPLLVAPAVPPAGWPRESHDIIHQRWPAPFLDATPLTGGRLGPECMWLMRDVYRALSAPL